MVVGFRKYNVQVRWGFIGSNETPLFRRLGYFLFSLALLLMFAYPVFASSNISKLYQDVGNPENLDYAFSLISQKLNSEKPKYTESSAEWFCKISLSKAMVTEDKDAQIEAYKSIINHAQKFIELYPDNPVWYAYIGFSSGRIAIALNGPSAVPYQKQIEESAKKAISLKPDYYLPYLNLGVYYRRAATLNPVMKFVVNTFLGGSISNASLKDSLEMLNKSKLLAAKKPLIWYELGITYKMMNKNSEALAAFEEVIRLPISAWGDSKIKAIATQQIKKIHMESRN